MRLPPALRRMDDRLLGSRIRRREPAGPFRDVFTVGDNPDRELIVNYGFAAVVYAALATVVGKIGRKS